MDPSRLLVIGKYACSTTKRRTATRRKCAPQANFRTDPPTRPRKLKADRAAVEPGLAIDPQL